MTTFKTPAEAVKEANTSTNQRIKDQFVNQHVHSNAGSLVEYCLTKSYEDNDSPLSWDDVENMEYVKEGQYKYIIDTNEEDEFCARIEDEDGDTIHTINDIEIIKKLIEDDVIVDADDTDGIKEYLQGIKVLSEYDELIDEYSDFEMETAEIFEWWIVSGYLYSKLKEQGEPVLTDGYMHFWGRTTTGQSISMDYCISRICADMEILDGQEYSWAKG